MESFSIDEVFLDMTGTSLIYPDPIATACEIKDKIYQELGFTVNVGISTNKLLAKMASDFEKPNKVHTLFPCLLYTSSYRHGNHCYNQTCNQFRNTTHHRQESISAALHGISEYENTA